MGINKSKISTNNILKIINFNELDLNQKNKVNEWIHNYISKCLIAYNGFDEDKKTFIYYPDITITINNEKIYVTGIKLNLYKSIIYQITKRDFILTSNRNFSYDINFVYLPTNNPLNVTQVNEVRAILMDPTSPE